MKYKIILLVLGALVSTPFRAHAETTQPANLSILSQIQEAKAQLEGIKLNYALTPHYKSVTQARSKTKKQVLTNYTLDIKDIALAVLDPTTNTTHIVLAMQRDSSFEFPPQYANFDIQKVRFNGVNTRFVVNKPAGGTVLALKYLITPTESGSKAQIEKDIYSGIYVPYSPELENNELANYGANYLDKVIEQAKIELSQKKSVSQAGKNIPEAINPRMVKALIYAEHMDTTEFLNNPDTAQLITKINVLLGGNEGETWKYSVSSAGAAGISQFIPSTYASLVKRHPDAKLIPDFVTGMRDHVNAIKSTFILLDDYIKAVEDRAPEYFLQGHAFDYGVAAYNGGPARVAKAAKQYGATWYEDNSSRLDPIENQVTAQSALVNSLKTKVKKTTNKTEKAKVQKVLNSEQAKLAQLKAERDEISSSILRNETVNYVLKIHRLVQVFNDHPVPAIVASK